jgi:hypothetical protein
MRRTIIVFLLGLALGAGAVMFLDSPADLPLPVDRMGEVIDEAGRGARHLQLQARVRAALALQKDFDLFGGISAEATENTITLRGKVATVEQRQLAELITRGVDGVEGVVNELEIEDAS